MSLLNDASLVLIPSGYKEDKVYSIIPSDGSGDLDFVRGSDGTRINSLGQVENVCWNLLQNSENFAVQNLVAVTIGTNVINAPNGTNTADSLIENGANSVHAVYNFSTVNYIPGAYTFSCYAKKGIRDWIHLQIYDSYNNPSVWIDINNGVIGNIGAGIQATIDNVNNGWYRVSITYTMTNGTGGWAIYSANYDGEVNYTGTNGATALYLWGAQVNVGALKPYFPTTDRLNVPRLTYENGCPSLLLEKQSTNAIKYSEDFTNALWAIPSGGGSVIVTGNATTAPDGTNTADKIQINSGTYNRIEQVNTAAVLTVGSPCTFSCYIKSVSGTGNVGIRSGQSGVSSVLSYTSQWQRLTWTFNAAATYEIPQFCNNTLVGGADASPTFYIWGAQLEASSYPTSYIKTTSTSVTRLADSCYKTGISSLIGQTEGTIFLDFYYDVSAVINNASARFQLSDGSLNNWILLSLPDAGTQATRFYMNNNGVDLNIYPSSNLLPGRNKIAAVYKSGDFVIYQNGLLVASSSSSYNVPGTSRIDLTGNTPNDPTVFETKFNQVLLFKRRLTNTELAQLTTL